MNHVDDTLTAYRQSMQAHSAAQNWLTAFEAAMRAEDALQIESLLQDECHWRDILAFTWDLSAVEGGKGIAAALAGAQSRTAARQFHLPPGRKPPRQVRRYGRDSVEAIFEFVTAVGRGAGIVRLSEDDGELKAWHLSTTLEELEGHAEKVGDNRPTGAAYSRNFGGDNWEDVRSKAVAYDDRDPTVLVVGGAQAGLSIAARLNQVGVDTLVVEQWPRIGDSWRKRYHSLALHNSIHLNHLPYMEFPPTWPKYIPKGMLGN